tara:strand:- start:170 stop:712 length:543 start_codon:yes stop_codon:yes gene_type:complete
MSFFNRFPLITYDSVGKGNYKLVTHILKRVKLRSGVRSGLFLYDSYDIKAGERPEDIATKWFGSAKLHWVILMTNNVSDRYHQWPMTQPEFDKFLTDKYGAGNEDTIHHYETIKDSGPTTSNGPSDYSHRVEVNSDHDNPILVSNRDYEERLQDKYRSIKLLNPIYLSQFVSEFEKLIGE